MTREEFALLDIGTVLWYNHGFSNNYNLYKCTILSPLKYNGKQRNRDEVNKIIEQKSEVTDDMLRYGYFSVQYVHEDRPVSLEVRKNYNFYCLDPIEAYLSALTY
jgi:uncharacterized protein YwgA